MFFFSFFSTNYHTKSCGGRTIIAGSPCGTTCLRATVFQFLKNCKSADNYKFVEATEIVGTSFGHRTKMPKLASCDHRKLIVGQM